MHGSDSGIASFGPFRLSPVARTLERDGVVLALGDRALDILIVLVEHAGQIVSQKELMSRVWRGLVVSPGNLRVHMTALRKVLGDGEGGARCIENVIGQGYCFIAPVTYTKPADSRRQASLPVASSLVTRSSTLPPALARMVGRDDTVRTIVADLRADRFVTIVGTGGMGKTTVAVSVAHAMLQEFGGRVCFVDIDSITDPRLLATTVASTLGLTIQSADAVTMLMSYLQTARLLLVLDNCEHVIDAAAQLAELIFSHAPEVYILATSREALRVEGEHAHWLRPLESPPQDTNVSAAMALTFPAVNLFVERAIASDNRFALTDANAPLVARVCGQLDGIALALELVAGRVGTYRLEGTIDLLNKHLGLHWTGRRTARPRHQTLHALLDWSYGLLPFAEQRVLRKLSVFVGTFTLEAARAIASEAEMSEAHLANALDSLIAKSLLSVANGPHGAARYRLLETARIYAIAKLDECNEAESTAERHARYFVRLLNSTSGGEEDRSNHHEHLGNLRAALDWYFGDHAATTSSRGAELGIDLAAASASTFLGLSLWDECIKWCQAALALHPGSSGSDKRELALREAFAVASMFTGASEVRAAILRALELARQSSDTEARLRLLASLHFYSHRITDFHASDAVSEEIDTVARTTNDATNLAISDWLRGSTQYCLGNQRAALQLFEQGFTHGDEQRVARAQQLGIYYRARGLNGLARVQWLCGYPDRALATARQAVAEAANTPPVNYSYALLIICHVLVWRGDLNSAQEIVERVMAQPHWQGRLVWFHSEALALKGEVLMRRGHVAAGVELLRGALSDMRTQHQKNLMLTVTACALAEGLVAATHLDEALAVITETLAHPPGNAETWEAPELLRVRASILLSMPQPNEVEAERCLIHALELSRRQGAKGWELRTAMTLARLRTKQARYTQARELLSNVYAQFTEGFDTRDLNAAQLMLQELGSDDANVSLS